MKLKRLNAPASWPIQRKTKKYIITPNPGPHRRKQSLPLGIIIRDMLGYARTHSEAQQILMTGVVAVNGVVRKNIRFPVGIMDIVSLGTNHYRVLKKKRLYLLLDNENKDTKLCRIEDKTALGKDVVQLNLHNGENIRVTKDTYATGDVLVMDAHNTIKRVIPFKKGSLALIIDGTNAGAVGTIREIVVTKGSQPNIVHVTTERDIPIRKDYVFVIGTTKPVIPVDVYQRERENPHSSEVG